MRRGLVVALALLASACNVESWGGPALPRPSGSVADVFADVDATPAASPSPVATATPAPAVQTGRALDVAIGGAGSFALALANPPRDLGQVRLTRRGRFAWARLAADDGTAVWRLVSEDGIPVLGYELASDQPDPWPAPGRGRSFYAAFGLDGGYHPARVLELDAAANPLPDATFDYRGLIRLQAGADGTLQLPVDDQGRTRALFLAVARTDGESWQAGLADDLRVGWLETP